MGGSSSGIWEQGGWSRQGPRVLDGSLGQLQRPDDLWLLLFLSPSGWQAIVDKWGCLKRKQGEELVRMGGGGCSVSWDLRACMLQGERLVHLLPAEKGSQLGPGFSMVAVACRFSGLQMGHHLVMEPLAWSMLYP